MKNTPSEAFKELAGKCVFRQEWRVPVLSDTLDWSTFDRDYIALGRARATPVTSSPSQDGDLQVAGGGSVVSIAVNEGHQQNVSNLPIGARTLFVDTRSGKLIMRGLNKFIDVEDAPLRWMDHCSHDDDGVEIRLQRKMAGFICTIFAPDDEHVLIATKHVLEGPHVDIATEILHRSLDGEKRMKLAKELHARRWSLVCECICTAKDVGHPVPEPAEMDNALFVLTAVNQSAVQELSVPFSELQAFTDRWGLRIVPTTDVIRTRVELETQLERRRPWNSALAEGWVVCIELPVASVMHWMEELLGIAVVAPADVLQHQQHHPSSEWRVTIRLKAKTTQYRILRGIRSAITEGHTLDTGRLLRVALSCWYADKQNTVAKNEDDRLENPRSLEAAVKERGVFAVLQEYEKLYIAARGRIHFREALWSVKASYQRLLSFYEREQQVAMNAPLCVIMFCGIPGTGKTTVATALASGVRGAPFVVNLRRDQVTQMEMKRVGQLKEGAEDAQLSNKQLRRVQGAVHRQMRTLIHTAVRLTAASMSDDSKRASPGVIIIDGCHATRSAREAWRTLFPSRTHLFALVHLTCGSTVTAARRVVRRQDHETVRGEDEGQHAVSSITRKFQLPEEDEADVLLEYSTDEGEGETTHYTDAAVSIAQSIAQRCHLQFEYDSGKDGAEGVNSTNEATVNSHEERPLVLDAVSLPDVLNRKESELLHAITGQKNLMTDMDGCALSLSHRRQKKSKTKLAFVHLSCTQSDLLEIVTRVVRSAITADRRTPPPPPSSSSTRPTETDLRRCDGSSSSADSSSTASGSSTGSGTSTSTTSSGNSSDGGSFSTGSLWKSFRTWFGSASLPAAQDDTARLASIDHHNTPPPTTVVSVARGHVKWLHGWLKLQRGRNETAKETGLTADGGDDAADEEEARIKRQLAMRFDNESLRASIERHHRHPHVTLFFCADYETHAHQLMALKGCTVGPDSSSTAPADPLTALLESNAIPLGTQCRIVVHAVLMDRYAVCLRVTIDPAASTDGSSQHVRLALENQLHECDAAKSNVREDNPDTLTPTNDATVKASGASNATPLHITVAYTSDVSAAYAGSLSSSFDVWEKNNNAVQAAKATKQIPTNRLTQHNFVELSLMNPIVLFGEVRLGDEALPPFSQ